MAFAKAFTVSGWRIEPQLNRMMCESRVIQLEPRVMQVLCKLAERPGDVFSRSNLLDGVWQGVTVGDEVLTRAISELRKAFDDDAKNPVVIETIYKTGYRLLAQVEPGRLDSYPPSFQLPRARRKGMAAMIVAGLGLAVVSPMFFLAASNGRQMDNSAAAEFRLSPLTSLPGEEFSPALSPDGETIVYAQLEPDSRYASLVTKSLKSGEQSVLFHGDTAHYLNAAWSPDGNAIAIVRLNEHSCEILRADVYSRRTDYLTECGQDSRPHLAWRPDGKALIISDRERYGTPYRLLELSLDDGVVTPLTSPPVQIVGDRHAAYSPDGMSVAYLRVMATGISDIFTKPLNGATERKITHDNVKIGGLAWRNNSGEILFSSNRRGEWDLWMANTASGKLSLLSLGAEAYGFSFSGQAQRIAFEKRSVDMNMWRAPMGNGAKQVAFASTTRWEANPSFSANGEFLAFASDRSGSPEIWIADIASNRMRRLTNFNGGLVLHPRWSPDGATIVFNARIKGNADIYTAEVETGVVQRWTNSPAIDATPHWSNDGTKILFSSNRSGSWQIWERPLEKSAAEQVTIDGGAGSEAHEAVNGLIMAKPGEPGLWSFDATLKKTKKILDTNFPMLFRPWTVVNNSIFYLDAEDGEVVIRRFDLLTSTNTNISAMPGLRITDLPYVDLAVPPEMDFFVFSRIDDKQSDIMILDMGPNLETQILAARGAL